MRIPKAVATIAFTLTTAVTCVCPLLAAEESRLPAQGQLNVFQLPQFAEEQNRRMLEMLKLLQQQRYADAEVLARKLVQQFPDWPAHNYMLAAVLARQDKTVEAFDSLKRALDRGFGNRQLIEKDPASNTLRGLPRFQALLDAIPRSGLSPLQRVPNATARQVDDGIALVDETNTVWEPNSNTLISAFAFPEKPFSDRVRNGDDPIARRLNLLYGRRQAAGNHSDLYDNRDNGHSALRRETFPQLSQIKYSAEAIAAHLHYGVNAHQLFNAITIGNASLAVTSGPYSRSLARAVQTKPTLMARAFQQYVNDHLYVFPEHSDYDPGAGDLYPANTPYMLVSQGSSGSDQPLLQAVAAILAAFDPSVKSFLRSKHLVMPTVQMIFRSSLKSLTSAGDYLTGKAHPPVFNGNDLDVRKMIFLANSLRKEEIPPRVDLKVIQESLPIPGISYFGPNAADEVLFSTPSAIARVVRSTDLEKRMVISASGTTEPNDHPLRFEWRVLQGDPRLIEITRLRQDGSEVELKVKWHEPRPATANSALLSSRVDIAVFAYNGFHYSAPAFVSFAYPTRQRRVYDLTGRIREVSYDPEITRNLYQDPVLFPRRGWRDLYAYTKDGKFVGWDRVRGSQIENFTRDGARVTKKDDLGRAVEAERLTYTFKEDPRELVTTPTGEVLVYRYQDSDDLLGVSTVILRK